MNNVKVKRRLQITPIQALMIMLAANLMITGGFISYYNYSNQVADQLRSTTNQTTTNIKNLIKAIDRSDDIDDNRTKFLLEATVKQQLRNYKQLVNATNQTNTLVTFLTDNFGVNSGYLERENFQYGQANDTLKFLKQSLINQQKGLDNQAMMIKNQEIIKKNQEKILNQTK